MQAVTERSIFEHVGTVLFWLGWPFWWIYFRLTERTRVAIIMGDEILVLRGWLSDGKWGLPGGGLRRGEDPRAGACREVTEETGLQVQPADLRPLGKQTHHEKGLTFTHHLFVVHVEKPVTLKRQRHEIAALQWLKLPDITDKQVSDEVRHYVRVAQERGGLLQY